MGYKKKYRYARKHHRQRPRLISSSQQEQQKLKEKTRGELWGLLRKLLGMAFIAALIGRNR
jgi:hypothetical protein